MVPWGTGDPISSGDLNTMVFLTEKPPPLSVSIGGGSMSPKAPSTNLFRGYFAQEEVVAMILSTISSLAIIYGLSNICRLAENANICISELSWLGSHSLLIYLYHMFFAWIISIITGFSLKYENVTPVIVFKSILLSLVCLGAGILLNIISDKLAKKQQA